MTIMPATLKRTKACHTRLDPASQATRGFCKLEGAFACDTGASISLSCDGVTPILGFRAGTPFVERIKRANIPKQASTRPDRSFPSIIPQEVTRSSTSASAYSTTGDLDASPKLRGNERWRHRQPSHQNAFSHQRPRKIATAVLPHLVVAVSTETNAPIELEIASSVYGMRHVFQQPQAVFIPTEITPLVELAVELPSRINCVIPLGSGEADAPTTRRLRSMGAISPKIEKAFHIGLSHRDSEARNEKKNRGTPLWAGGSNPKLCFTHRGLTDNRLYCCGSVFRHHRDQAQLTPPGDAQVLRVLFCIPLVEPVPGRRTVDESVPPRGNFHLVRGILRTECYAVSPALQSFYSKYATTIFQRLAWPKSKTSRFDTFLM